MVWDLIFLFPLAVVRRELIAELVVFDWVGGTILVVFDSVGGESG